MSPEYEVSSAIHCFEPDRKTLCGWRMYEEFRQSHRLSRCVNRAFSIFGTPYTFVIEFLKHFTMAKRTWNFVQKFFSETEFQSYIVQMLYL